MTIAELIERLETARPNRGLDADIAIHFDIIAPREWWSINYFNSDMIPCYTASIDAAVALCGRVLPGWGWRVATCCVSDDAWVFPDFNSPEHGDRLKREFNQEWDWSELTDVDLRPPGRHAIALVLSILRAKQIIEEVA
jgi:hypothetical protein